MNEVPEVCARRVVRERSISERHPNDRGINDAYGHYAPKQHKRFDHRKKRALFSLTILSMCAIILRNISRTLSSDLNHDADDRSLYGPSNITNKYIAQFEDVLLDDLSKSSQVGHDFFIPLIVENGKLLCRRRHKTQMATYRSRWFAQMVQKGLKMVNFDDGFPILVMEEDVNGCNIMTHRDDVEFPRFSWSIPSDKFGQGWCGAIGMPSYESWIRFRGHKRASDWQRTFRRNERNYPWSSKKNKAVWRGSTTYDGSQFEQSDLGETPRGRLVTKSLEHPELIDAGFTQIIQKFEPQKEELAAQTTVAEFIDLEDMMKYKGV